MRQTFRQEEAEQILTEAVRRSVQEQTPLFSEAPTPVDHVPRERLQAMAEELGIPLSTLEAVLAEREAKTQQVADAETRTQARQAFIIERHAGFYPHLWPYVGVNGMLIAIYLLTTPHGYFWPIWPMLGWGLGLFMHAMAALPTRGASFESAFSGWYEARQQRAKRRAEKDRQRTSEVQNEVIEYDA